MSKVWSTLVFWPMFVARSQTKARMLVDCASPSWHTMPQYMYMYVVTCDILWYKTLRYVTCIIVYSSSTSVIQLILKQANTLKPLCCSAHLPGNSCSLSSYTEEKELGTINSFVEDMFTWHIHWPTSSVWTRGETVSVDRYNLSSPVIPKSWRSVNINLDPLERLTSSLLYDTVITKLVSASTSLGT